MLLCAGLYGCGTATDKSQSQYLLRLARVLEAPLPTLAPIDTPAFPGKRELLLQIPDESLSWTEFARLHRCDLGELMGFRNSSLGQVMTQLRRLQYELQWRELADRCMQQQSGQQLSEQTTALLNRVMTSKVAALDAVFWNAVIASDAMQRWMGQSATASNVLPTGSLLDLADQARRFEGATVTVAKVDDALRVLSDARRVGLAQRQWQQARVLLERATMMLRSHGRRVCRNGQPTPKAERLKSVFVRYYVGQEQPGLARLMQEDATWVNAFADLYAQLHRHAPAALQIWYRGVLDPGVADSHWQRTRAAFPAHARAWQALADHCGMNLFAADGAAPGVT